MNKNIFYYSVFGGIIVWLFIYLITPVTPKSPYSLNSLFFIFLNVMALILGYSIFRVKSKTLIIQNKISINFIYTIIGIVTISFILRYVDILVYRKLSLFNSIAQNKKLISSENSNIIFIIASLFKQLYFVPLIFCFSYNVRNKFIRIISFILILFPLFEAYLRGSRNTIFFSFFFLLLVLVYFRIIRFHLKQVLIILSGIILCFFISTNILIKRETVEKNLSSKRLISDAEYSKFLKIDENVVRFIESIKSPKLMNLAISSLQVGQYYVHGIFEFDYLMKYYQDNIINYQKGKFIFFPINRFTNIINLTNNDLTKVQEYHPRIYTFITLFGGLYIDFGWISILIMFFYGAIQKFLYNMINGGKMEYLPLFLFILFSNFFMLTFNFIRGYGTYYIVVYLLLILVFQIKSVKNIIKF